MTIDSKSMKESSIDLETSNLDQSTSKKEETYASSMSPPLLLPSKAGTSKLKLDAVWEVPSGSVGARSDFAVAKYSKVKPLNAALLDSYIEGFQRTTTLFFGRIVSNPDDLPAFAEPLGYSMTYNAMPTGNGNALHRHNSVEIFVALDAPFEIAYGSNGEFKALLQPWDIVACPAEAIHSYKNVGEDGGQILTFLCGKPAICWASGVVEQARARGAICDDSGILLAYSAPKRASLVSFDKSSDPLDEVLTLLPSRQNTADSCINIYEDTIPAMPPSRQTTDDIFLHATPPSRQTTDDSIIGKAPTAASELDLAASLRKRLSMKGIEKDELVLSAGALDKFVYRYSERDWRSLEFKSSAGTMAVEWKHLIPMSTYVPDQEHDILVVVLNGSVICQNHHYTHLDVLKQPSLLTAGTQGSVLLIARSKLPHNMDFFFDAEDAEVGA